jgi:leucyl-tRNA synthetase
MTTSPRQVELGFAPVSIDQKWQDRWEADELHKVPDDDPRPKWYEMTMYPYPSGDLHIGHWYAMAPSDAHARFRRMQGYNVLHPIGFDAFGLPAENDAIRKGIHPRLGTDQNIKIFRRQLDEIGAMYDWSREIDTTDPAYYRWTQWIFLQMHARGLAYKASMPINWCPSCKCGLANEEVVDGACERCGTLVSQKEMSQWMLRITHYAERLLRDLDKLDWPEKVKTMQANWIGRSEGVEISFDISHNGLEEKEISTFTTRIDTIFGVTFMVLAPEHPLVSQLTTEEQREQVESYVIEARQTSEIERLSTEKEKTGVPLGTYAVNRLNGERVPIYTADYVLTTYGTGAVMGVPAHDERDYIFARKHGLPVRMVIAPLEWDGKEPTEAHIGPGFMTNSGKYDGMTDDEGKAFIADDVEKYGWGQRTTSYRLRDWLISRQRYWGTPIPVVYCENCNAVPVPEDQLPVLLPEDAEFKPTGESPLVAHQAFRNTTCPRCGGPALRETDTMDTFVDSSWYMLRYTAPKFAAGAFDPDVLKHWLPVDQYTGGAEHAVMHLLYSRFFIKAMRDIGMVDFDEPFLRLFNQGVILGSDHEKMSKSRGNVVNPDDVVGVMGADAVRCFLMFIGPWDQGGPWSDVGINGVARWLNRVWALVERNPDDLSSGRADTQAIRETVRVLHQTMRKCHGDLDRFKFNTAIASLMELVNHLSKVWAEATVDPDTWRECIEKFLLMLAPIAPHIAEELWEKTGHAYSIHQQSYPEWDDALAADDTITLVVQVNGRVRDRIEVPANIDESTANELALASEKVQPYTEGKVVDKAIYVPGRLVNVVVV